MDGRKEGCKNIMRFVTLAKDKKLLAKKEKRRKKNLTSCRKLPSNNLSVTWKSKQPF